jgi:hypothetical protein
LPFCKSCGRINDPNAKFCGVCGASLGGFDQPAQASAPKPTYSPQPAYEMPPPPPPPPDYLQPSTYQPPQDFRQPTVYQQPPAYQPPPTIQAAPQFSSAPQNGSERPVGVILVRKPKSMGRYDTWAAVITNVRMIFAQITSQMITNASMQARDQAKADGKGFFGQWGDQLKATFLYSQKYLSMEPNAIQAETLGNFALDNRGISEVKIKLKNISRGHEAQINEFELEVSSAQGRYEFRMDERHESTELLKQVYGDRVKMPFGYFSHGVNVKLL